MENVVPMFPLPGVFLFPRQVLPLHVFEPRYRQMMEDLLDGPGRMVMGTILEGEPPEEERAPDVLKIAGLGEIARHEKLPDGRFKLLLFGLQRVRIEEVPSDRPYRLVQWQPWAEVSPSDEDAEGLNPRLVEALCSRAGFGEDQLGELSTADLTDALAQCLGLPQIDMERIFSEPVVAERADQVLAAHRDRPEED